MLVLTLIIATTVSGLLAEESTETDGEISRKVLGSRLVIAMLQQFRIAMANFNYFSVVTSVSVIMDTGNGSKAVFADAVGKPVSKPAASQLASPINLLNPDRYEFYTFDDSGDLIKRLMTLEEIQGIIASGDGDGLVYNSQSSLTEESTPEKKVDDVVNNVQNVLKEEMETHKNSESKPIYDTPDVSSSWTMILPAIFGNSGEEVTPERPLAMATPETIVIEPTAEISTTFTSSKQTTAAPVSTKPSSAIPVNDYIAFSTVNAAENTDNPLTTGFPAPVTSLLPPKPSNNKKPIINSFKKNQTNTKISTSVKPPLLLNNLPELKDNVNPAVMASTKQPNNEKPADLNTLNLVSTSSSASPTSILPSTEAYIKQPTTVSKEQTVTYTTQNSQTDSQTLPYFTQIIIDKLTSLSLGSEDKDAPSTLMTTEKLESTTDSGIKLPTTDITFTKLPQTTENSPQQATNSSATELHVSFEPELTTNKNVNASTFPAILTATTQSDSTTPYNKEQIAYDDSDQTTQSKPTTTVEANAAEKLAVTELLDQLLLTSTNIYQLNSELTEQSTQAEDQRFEISDYPTTNSKTETVKSDVQVTTPSSDNSNVTVTNESENSASLEHTMTEPSVISSIEALLSQAMGNAEVSADAAKEAEKVQELMTNTNIRNMSQVQSEAATLMSNIIGNPNTEAVTQTVPTTAEPDLSLSFGSLLSQIVGANIPSLTTVDDIPTSTETLQRNEDVATVPEEYKTENNVPLTTSEQYTYQTTNKENYTNPAEYITTETTTYDDFVVRSTSESILNIPPTNISSSNEDDRNQTSKPAKSDLSLEMDFNSEKQNNQNETQPGSSTEAINYSTVQEEATISSTDFVKTTEQINLNKNTLFPTSSNTENYADEVIGQWSLENNSETSTVEQSTVDFSTTIQNFKDDPSTDSTLYGSFTAFINNNLKLKNITNGVINQSETTWALVPTVPPHSSTSVTQIPQENSTSFNPEISSPVNLIPHTSHPTGLEGTTAALDSDVYKFVELCNELSLGFWKSVTAGGISSTRSVVLSPFAATSLLGMVFLGARGATSGEMNEILKLDDMVTFNPHMIFRNVSESIEVSRKSGVAVSAIIRELYSDKNKGKLLSFYKERARQFYDGHVEEANFKEIGDVIRRRTNLLVKRYTWGKVPEYLKESSIAVKPPLAGVSVSIFQVSL